MILSAVRCRVIIRQHAQGTVKAANHTSGPADAVQGAIGWMRPDAPLPDLMLCRANIPVRSGKAFGTKRSKKQRTIYINQIISAADGNVVKAPSGRCLPLPTL